MRSRLPILTVAGLILAGTCACGIFASSPPAAPPVPATAIQPPSRYLGYAGPASGLSQFAADTGTHPTLLSEYLQPQSTFTPPPTGVTPFISLATTLAPGKVLAGAEDQAITNFGHQLAAYAKPVAVSIDAEGNGPWYSYGTKHATAAQYVAMYRHIRAVLIQAGDRNVIWVWAISNSPPITHPSLLRSLYPGDAYVNWIGVDGYFIGSENSWQQVFTRVFTEVRTFSSRQFLITETSVKPGPHATEWVQDLFAGIDSDPEVVGFIWFDYNKASQYRDDWRLEDDPAALASFQAAAGKYH